MNETIYKIFIAFILIIVAFTNMHQENEIKFLKEQVQNISVKLNGGVDHVRN